MAFAIADGDMHPCEGAQLDADQNGACHPGMSAGDSGIIY